MIAFPDMLVTPAEAAGMKVPENLKEFSHNEYPHWYVYCAVQLGAPMPYASAHFDNAVLIAKIPDTDIRSITSKFNRRAEGKEVTYVRAWATFNNLSISPYAL